MNTNNAPHATSAKPVATPQSYTIELAGFVFERTKKLTTHIDLELYTELASIDDTQDESFTDALKAVKAIAKEEHQQPSLFPYSIHIGVYLKGKNQGKAILSFDLRG